MPIECPRCGRVNPETSRRCDCGQDLSTVAEQTHIALQPDAPSPAAKDSLPRRCPLCQGTNIRIDGWSGLEARAQFGKKWMGTGDTGYALNCFACMGCGYVGHYLSPGDLQRLQTAPIMADWPPPGPSSGCLGLVLLLLALVVGACVSAGRLLAG